MPWVVHGVLAAGALDSEALAAVGEAHGASAREVSHGPLTAVLTATDADELLPTRANLLRHTQVLEALLAHATVVPTRFGIVVDEPAEIAGGFLEPRREPLLAALERLSGRIELRLRGRYDQEAVLREILRTDREARRLRGREDLDARIALGERIQQAIEAFRARDRARALEHLGDHVVDARDGTISEPMDAIALSLLVGRERREAMEAAVDRLGASWTGTVHLELVGPMPPFSFAEDDAPQPAT